VGRTKLWTKRKIDDKGFQIECPDPIFLRDHGIRNEMQETATKLWTMAAFLVQALWSGE